jgi:methionyl-tRNA formyltransferase
MPIRSEKKTCIILTGRREDLNSSMLLFAKQIFDVMLIVEHSDSHPDEEALYRMQPDFVFSFLNEKILKGRLLELKNVNFHPAPPEWPGRGGASLAIFNRSETYGATSHIMESGVDCGPILAVRRFAVLPDESCESLFDRAEHACLELFYQIGSHISKHGDLPESSGESWKRHPMSRKEFEKWLELDIDNEDEAIRKLKASRHSRYPGPYIVFKGYRFGLMGEYL